MSKRRVEAFSDGVFAVAITILVFNLQAPKAPPGQLWHALGAQWPTYAAYVASFLTIGIMWVNHHAMLERLDHLDRPLMMLNLLLLMAIVAVPFPTALLGQFIPRGGPDATAAATVYGILAVAIGVFFSSIWIYALNRPGLLVAGFDREESMRRAPRFAVGSLMYLLSIPLAQFSPIAVVFLLAATAVYYAFEQLPEIKSNDDG